MKKIIISEKEKKNILEMHYNNKNVVSEQSEDTKNIKYVQEFLNQKLKAGLTVDGVTGDKTKQAISKYQSMIGVNPDGVWGYDTQTKMPQQDKKILDQIKSKGSFFGGLFGN